MSAFSRLFVSAALLPFVAPALRAQPAALAAPAAADSPLITLGDYEVTASRLRSPATDLATTVTIAGPDQLADENADYTLELLGRIPGLTLTDFNQGVITADVSMRGFNGEGGAPHIRLLVDGVPYNLNNGYNDLGALLPLEIERIEVVKGTADPRFGLNAIAGAIDVRTAPPQPGGRVKALVGSFGLRDVQARAGFATNGFSHAYSAGHRRSDGYRDHATLEKHTFAGQWAWTGPAERWRVAVHARTHAFEADAPGYLPAPLARATPTASPAYSATDGGAQDNRQFSLHADARASALLRLDAKLYHHEVERHRFVRFTAAGTQQERIEDERHLGAVLRGEWRPTDDAAAWRVDAGLEFHRQDADNQRYATVERTRTATTRNHRYRLDNLGAYAGAELRPQPAWRLTAALRVDDLDGAMTNRVTGARTPLLPFGLQWQPKLGTAWQFAPAAQAYASWGRSFQIGAGAAAYGTKPLDASRNDTVETGLHARLSGGVHARLALWQQTATDEVKPKADGSGDSENVGETERRGADLELTWPVTRNLAVWAALTRQYGRLVEPGPTQPALRGRTIDHVPGWSARAGADWTIAPAWRLSAHLAAQDPYFLTLANNTGRFGGYTLAHADLRYTWRHATVGLHVKNLFDRYHEYVWHDGTQTLHSPGDGRAVQASVTLAF